MSTRRSFLGALLSLGAGAYLAACDKAAPPAPPAPTKYGGPPPPPPPPVDAAPPPAPDAAPATQPATAPVGFDGGLGLGGQAPSFQGKPDVGFGTIGSGSGSSGGMKYGGPVGRPATKYGGSRPR